MQPSLLACNATYFAPDQATDCPQFNFILYVFNHIRIALADYPFMYLYTLPLSMR